MSGYSDAAMKKILVLLLGLLVIGAPIAACGNSEGFRDGDSEIDLDPSSKLPDDLAKVDYPKPRDPNKPLPEQKAITGVSDDLAKKPKVGKGEGEPPKELQGTDVVVGDGPQVKSGDKVAVQYVGVLFKDGKQFDSSWDRGKKPFEFVLGQRQVIQGWDDGVAGMKVGGRRVLVIPSELAYGEQGSPPTIPPKSALVFVVDLKKKLKKTAADSAPVPVPGG